MRSLRWIAVFAATLIPTFAQADVPSLNNITGADYEKIVKELSANFAYSSLTPASSLGGLWGFEIGVVGGITKTPEILALVRRTSASFKEDKFPHAAALVRVGAPLGLTAELMVLPSITVSDLKLSQYSGAAMWTVTDVFFEDLPVTVAVKGYLSKTKLEYTQRLQNSSTGNQAVDAKITFDDTLIGGQLLVSKKLLVFEPYVGLGYVRAKGDLAVTAATAPGATIFLSGGSSASANPTSAQLLAGLDIRLLFISLGAEYSRAFGTSSVSGRFSFRF